MVWAALDGKNNSFTAVPLSLAGRPLGKARVIAKAPENLGLVAVRSAASGFSIVYTSPGPESEELSVLCTDGSGASLGPPVTLGKLGGQGLWVEAVPVSGGSLVFFAIRPASGKRIAEIDVVSLDAACRPGDRSSVLRNALAWQVVPTKVGATLAVVRASEGPFGSVEAIAVDAAGKAGPPTLVSRDAAPDLDLDAARVGDNVVLAWTDRRTIEPRLMGAALDETGKLTVAPRALTAPEGEQTLLRLIPPAESGGGAYLAWENLSDRRPVGGRIIQLSGLDKDAKLSGPRARLEYGSDDGGLPELRATPRGLALLTLAPVCARGTPCDKTADIAPTFVELTREFAPITVEPLRLEPLDGAFAELGFGLGCSGESCFAIAALARTPAPIFATVLESRSSSFVSPVQRVDETGTPRVIAHEALKIVPSCAAFALEDSGGQEYLATITDFDPTTPWKRLDRPASDGRYEPLRAELNLERLSSEPKRVEGLRASPLSIRAHSYGGVTLAPGQPERGELLVAWAGVDQGNPQVFLTLIGKSGARIAQRMLTRIKGDLGDIAAVWVGDGWVVSWVDDRSGDLEVFAAKIDRALNRVGKEQRITDAVGAAADPTLVFDGTTLRLAWSDARGAEVPGHADVFSVVLGARDAAPVGREVRLATTRAHSFSPSIQTKDGGFAVAWTERGEEGGEPGSIALVTISADGTVGPLSTISAGAAEPRSVALACAAETCRLSAIVEREHRTSLSVSSWTGTSVPTQVVPVLSLLGTAGAAVAPLIRGETIVFVDGGVGGTRVRRAQLAW